MKSPEAYLSTIRARWAFAAGILLGGLLVHYLGPLPSLTYGAGVLTMGLVASAMDRRGR